MPHQKKIAVIGLGYVGLPLAIEFAKHFAVAGFDIKEKRIQELKAGIDTTQEADIKELQTVCAEAENRTAQKGLFFTNVLDDIQAANIFIVTVPTPIDRYNAPDLQPLLTATEMIGRLLKPICTEIAPMTPKSLW